MNPCYWGLFAQKFKLRKEIGLCDKNIDKLKKDIQYEYDRKTHYSNLISNFDKILNNAMIPVFKDNVRQMFPKLFKKKVIITEHAKKRIKERAGISKANCTGISQKAFKEGDIIKKVKVKRNNVFLIEYSDFYFVFSNNTLVTMYRKQGHRTRFYPEHIKEIRENYND